MEIPHGQQCNNLGTPAIPDPEKIQTPGISDGLKRKLFFGVVAVIVLVILSSVFSPSTPNPPNAAAPRRHQTAAQTPSVAQVNELKQSIDSSAKLLQDAIDRDRNADTSRDDQKQTLADIQKADALRDAQQQRALYDATHGGSITPTEQRQQLNCSMRISRTKRSLPIIASLSRASQFRSPA